jgi:hypothetical protein
MVLLADGHGKSSSWALAISNSHSRDSNGIMANRNALILPVVKALWGLMRNSSCLENTTVERH